MKNNFHIKFVAIGSIMSFTSCPSVTIKIDVLVSFVKTENTQIILLDYWPFHLSYFLKTLRPEFFYYLVLGRFVTKIEIKWPKPVCWGKKVKWSSKNVYWRPLDSYMDRVKWIWYLSPMHPRSLARTSAACSYKQWVKRNLQTESRIPGLSEWLGMCS